MRIMMRRSVRIGDDVMTEIGREGKATGEEWRSGGV